LTLLNLRDRDSIVTAEPLIFRVYGYNHPSNAYICDLEYAPAKIFQSKNPKALRSKNKQKYYKFYEDEGLKFIFESYPQYKVFCKPLNQDIVGVKEKQIMNVRKPGQKLREMLSQEPRDELQKSLLNVMNLIQNHSNLSSKSFGVFGSLLQSFYHPKFSDLDFIVYGGKSLEKLRELLKSLYNDGNSSLRNEFENEEAVKNKHWKFLNYTLKEYLWHQKRKLIYSVYKNRENQRLIKTEFEPVKDWKEIRNEWDDLVSVDRKGWIKAILYVTDAENGAFMQSIYQVTPIEILEGEKVDDLRRIVSYVEEFRLQAFEDEIVYVEGNLEKVQTKSKVFHQITLSYCPRYYEQVVKVIKT